LALLSLEKKNQLTMVRFSGSPLNLNQTNGPVRGLGNWVEPDQWSSSTVQENWCLNWTKPNLDTTINNVLAHDTNAPIHTPLPLPYPLHANANAHLAPTPLLYAIPSHAHMPTF
jgi:hypothetical protein